MNPNARRGKGGLRLVFPESRHECFEAVRPVGLETFLIDEDEIVFRAVSGSLSAVIETRGFRVTLVNSPGPLG